MKLLKVLNIKTNNLSIYEEALTHTSYANENNVESYERLEFLGDAVLQLIISEYLFLLDKEPEGILTKKRAKLVCENALYIYGQELEINNYIKLGRGEIEAGGSERKAIIADITEAFFGALFIDKGYDATKKLIYQNIIPIIERENHDFMVDYKTKFQELVQTEKKSLNYVLLKETGPAHDRKYTMAVKIDGVIYGIGEGGSKKEAEQNAAKEALKKSVFNDEKAF